MFGAEIAETENESGEKKIVVKGFGKNPKLPSGPIDVGNSGTTLRFMTAFSGIIDGRIELTGDESIQKRPNTPLLETLNKMGANAYSVKNNNCAPLIVEGKIKPCRVSIDGGMSSQFISALLLSCPLLESETVLSIDGELKSKPYVDITLEIAKIAGIQIAELQKNENDANENAGLSYQIPGNQTYAFSDYIIPGDFSSVSYVLAAGALIPGAEIVVKNIFPSAQGDSALVEILEKMGADISWNKEAGIIKVSNTDGRRLKGIVCDVGKTPDLVPTLAVLGAFADGEMKITNAEHVRLKETDGEMKITNAEHVRLKETDRLKAMAAELSKLGAAVEETKDGLIISGEKSKKMKGAKLHGWDDHRIVMSLFIAGMMIGDVEIDTSESIKISYPEFFEDMKNAGAVFEKIN
jgi:5-enolpyruvylshikimate-3-phosphate synthase